MTDLADQVQSSVPRPSHGNPCAATRARTRTPRQISADLGTVVVW